MAVTKQDMDLTSGLTVVRDSDADATAENDINSGAATLYLVQVDNTANSTAASFLKIYNALAPTVGTTAPDMIIRAAGGKKVTLAIPEGLSFGTGVSFACLTTGGTAGTTNPTNDVVAVLVVA